jgi:DNA end-binding protein Ku
LAAVKANDKLLVLELMHFADELLPAEGLKVPETKQLGKREETMAMTLVDQMTQQWDPKRYIDDYKSNLKKVINAKVDAGGKEIPTDKPKQRAPTNVIDLVAVLQESLKGAGRADVASRGKGRAKKKPATKKRSTHRKAA